VEIEVTVESKAPVKKKGGGTKILSLTKWKEVK
jgi:hypothetical protein